MARTKQSARKNAAPDATKQPRKQPRKQLATKAAQRAASGSSGAAVRKPHRYHPGTVALREIHALQRDPNAKLIPKAAFERLVREIAQMYKPDARFTCTALDAIKEAAESEITKLFQITQTLLAGGLHVVGVEGKTNGLLKGRTGLTLRAMKAARLILYQIMPQHPFADGGEDACKLLGYRRYGLGDHGLVRHSGAAAAMDAARKAKRAQKKAKKAAAQAAVAAGAPPALEEAPADAAPAEAAADGDDDDGDDDMPIGEGAAAVAK